MCGAADTEHACAHFDQNINKGGWGVVGGGWCMCEVQIRDWAFQTGSKTHSDRQPVVDSPQNVGVVSCT